jgi:3'-phosphoadenosine 5'-phosphosulfate sulfotransferase (PAPS reductase)/FAD synthetase
VYLCNTKEIENTKQSSRMTQRVKTTRKPAGFDDRLQESITLLQKAEPLALRYSDGGYYLAFSGGKDSQALYHVALMAGVKFEAYMSATSVDPPEVLRFVRSQYPKVTVLPPPTKYV